VSAGVWNSLSLSIGNERGILRWLGLLFKKQEDPISKNIYDAIAVIDKMISTIDITRRSLMDAQEEHTRKAQLFASEGKKNYQGVFLDELRHIGGLLNMLEKVRIDLIRVKTRLRTVATMERPLNEIPEVIAEIRNLRPMIEKVMPNLTSMVMEVERKVEDVMISTSLPSAPTTIKNQTVSPIKSKNKTSEYSMKAVIPPEPPSTKPVQTMKKQSAWTVTKVKHAILVEIKNNGGILDIGALTRRYGIPKSMIYKALHQLENEGKIRLSK
jgi:ribosomal protein S25